MNGSMNATMATDARFPDCTGRQGTDELLARLDVKTCQGIITPVGQTRGVHIFYTTEPI